MGLPDHVFKSDYGSGGQRQWCWYDHTPSCFYDDNGDGLVEAYN